GGYLMSGAGKYGPGVDSKADGGYIVVAPAVSRSGPYEWAGDGGFDHPLTPLPEPLAARLRPAEAGERVTVPVTPWARPGISSGRLAGLVRVVLDAPSNTRNDRLHWAAKKAGEMVAAGEIAEQLAVAVLTDAGIEVGLTVREIGHATQGTIGSGLRKGRVTP
nr:bifunctional DNA primase/polymerase [Sporichthyaceae bacterium]